MDMSVNPIIARRTVLAAGLAGAGAAALAACGSGGTSSSSNQGNSSKPGQKVASLGGIKVGDSASATIDGQPVLVCRTGQNSAVMLQRHLHPRGLHGQPGRRETGVPVPSVDV